MRGSTAERTNLEMTNPETTTPAEAAAVAERGTHVAPEKAASKKDATHKKGAPKASKGAKKAKTAPTAKNAKKQAAKAPKGPAAKKTAKPATEARDGSKKSIVLGLLSRKDGATLAEIAGATAWQNHSIRGFISGHLTKKMGLTVESSKNASGERVYKVAK